MSTMRTVTTWTIFLATLASARTSEAGLFDWLFPPRIPATVSTYYPPQVVATQTNQLVVSYRPRVRYQTTWARVPVTVYRPVANVDPASGCTVSCMRPCTTYEWQRRRVPVTTFRPRYSVIQGACQVVQQPVISAGCSGCGVDPGFSGAATTTTTTPGGSYYDYPAGVSPSTTPSAVPSGAEPADTRPRLRGEPPAVNDGQGASILRHSDPLSTLRRNPTRALAPVVREPQPQRAIQKPTVNRSQPTTVQRHQLKPIPDPERRNKQVTPPALIKPAGRTVQLRSYRVWASAPIEWAAPVKVRPASAVAAPTGTPDESPAYDDSGWKSAR